MRICLRIMALLTAGALSIVAPYARCQQSPNNQQSATALRLKDLSDQVLPSLNEDLAYLEENLRYANDPEVFMMKTPVNENGKWEVILAPVNRSWFTARTTYLVHSGKVSP